MTKKRRGTWNGDSDHLTGLHLACSTSLTPAVGQASCWALGVQTGGSRVWLRPPPYFRPGTNGRVTFSINLWFKVGDSRGKVFQYLLSQMGKPDGDEWGPSQVRSALLGRACHCIHKNGSSPLPLFKNPMHARCIPTPACVIVCVTVEN